VNERLFLLDASAFWRLGSPELDLARGDEVAGWIARGLVASSTPLMLEIRAGTLDPPANPADLPFLWNTERAERRSVELQLQMRSIHQHLGIPAVDYLVAAIAEEHSASILHYDSDFERLAKYSDLASSCEPLTPLGSIS
jgi:predicted nucleic acid-binding protein